MSRRKGTEKKEISQEWLTTYSDMMTLILTFFVLLYSFSLVDNTKFKAIAMSLAQALGGQSGYVIESGNIGPTPVTQNTGIQNDTNTKGDLNADLSAVKANETEKVYKKVNDFIKANKLQGKVTIKEDVRGVIIELQEKILFDSGSAEIKKESLPLLDKLSGLLSNFSNEIIVEGHTDNVPINSGYYQSNWELSTDRAVKVVRYLTEKKGLNSSKYMAIGCGEFRPIADNNTSEGRQKNRRVNILIVTTEKESK